MLRKLQFIAKKFDNVRFCVRLLCYYSTLLLDIRHQPHFGTDMAVSLLHFTSIFSNGRITALKEVKNIIIWGMWRVCYAVREIVSLVHARERDVT